VTCCVIVSEPGVTLKSAGLPPTRSTSPLKVTEPLVEINAGEVALAL
jgi:hypothetical protein